MTMRHILGDEMRPLATVVLGGVPMEEIKHPDACFLLAVIHLAIMTVQFSSIIESRWNSGRNSMGIDCH